MSNALKSKKNFTKAVLQKLGSVAEEVSNIILIDSLAKKTIESIEEGRKKINGIAHLFMYLGHNPTVINLARTSKSMKLLAENEVRRNQVWSALDEQLQAQTPPPPAETAEK